MINAAEARAKVHKIIQNWFSRSLESIDKQVEVACQKGLNYCRFDIVEDDWSEREKKNKMMISHLESLGYQVKREQGSDQRDGVSWDYLIISW